VLYEFQSDQIKNGTTSFTTTVKLFVDGELLDAIKKKTKIIVDSWPTYMQKGGQIGALGYDFV
jgi:hypothetical protein